MQCSPEKLAANRANSLQSTGPRTDAGKVAARGNALKHGLTGEGLALPDEDASVIQETIDNLERQMNPKTEAGFALLFQIALCTLRLGRFATAETGIGSQRILDAGYAFDDAQVARRNECRAKLYQDPATQLDVLSRFEAGVHWVLDAWDALACALTSEKQKNWKQPQFALFEALNGRSTEFPSYFDSTFWNLAVMGDEGARSDPELPGDSPAAKCRWAREQMLTVCKEETARWEAMLEPAAVADATARANAIKAARYDGTKEGLLAKKYEAATRRELHKALKDFKVVEAEFAEPESIAENSEPNQTCVELASFFSAIEPGFNPPAPMPTDLAQTSQIPQFGSVRFVSDGGPGLRDRRRASALIA